MFKTKPRGFTIVELLVVVVVISILSAIIIVTYNGIQQNARNTARVQTVDAILKSMALYQAENGSGSLYNLLPATGSGDGWCFGSDYQSVAPSPTVSCRYVVPNTGSPYYSSNIQALTDALKTETRFSFSYAPVTQLNFSNLVSVTSSSPFITRNQYSDTGQKYTLNGGSLLDHIVLLSFRLEGVNKNCQIPVVQLSSQTATQANYITGQPYSVVNGGATECWVWLDL